MAVTRDLINRLHKADYQREFGDLVESMAQGVDPAENEADLLDLNYNPEEGGLPNGSIKFVVGKGLYYLDTTSVDFVDHVNVLATGLPVGRWLLYGGGGGGGGGSNTYEETATIPYSTGGGLIVLSLVVPGEMISEIRVSVKEPFNGVGASIVVGTATNPTEFFGPGHTTLALVCDFVITPLYISPVPDQVQVILNTAGSTTGAVVVYYRIRRI